MNKRYIIPIVLAMLMVPAFMLAQQAMPRDTAQTQTFGGNVVDFFVGSPCLVPVYHTNFVFPPEGGVVIRVGDQLFFVADYLAQCEGVAEQGEIVRGSSDGPSEVVTAPKTGGGAFLNFVIGDPCLVPVYHTNFAFPPEGGEIVEIGGQLFFAKTYLEGCEDAGD